MTDVLRDLQSSFAKAVQQPIAVSEQVDGPRVAESIATGSARLSPIDQLEVYREQFWLRHVGALEEDFPTIVHLLGHAEFHRLAERYLEAQPSSAFSLRDLGVGLGRFLTSTPPYSHDPLLAECAQLEWAFVEAFDAVDQPPVDAASIAAIPDEGWPSAHLTLHPALQRVAASHPVHEFRAAVRSGAEPPRPDARRTYLAVYRGRETLQYVELEPMAFDLLERLARGEPLGDACEAVAANAASPDAEAVLEAKVGQWFQFWSSAGWVTGVSWR
jgi:hypothetical protein